MNHYQQITRTYLRKMLSFFGVKYYLTKNVFSVVS